MLDSTTKSRIDSARDILVGKVPDPKSQVEQITIALIYKFMDDMDRQSEELGGKATFFTGEFKKYRWAQLLDKRYGGHERLLLYAEGIEKMNENKNIPQLFRDIFKGVFLPYRDPETLNLFLKEINGFSYDHSERLGDAFEYLLSVLGTQGDAGQFRTPRHIIDFIVAVVNPKKDETILDPACGTAGFLISAYKHIMNCGLRIADCGLKGEKSAIKNQQSKIINPLSPDERARLMTNFRGYDIAPDMVRLARANMYLHGFPNPTIHEYDALTSEERWDERCDVILANPPFMTPKGGVRPHNRFSIKAKRSEVLFVDYIAEHLNPGGRAGIIVPEGIIFQGGNAYKQLRRMLVENYLWAVVSLPAGVFNPYSGVKTSILFLDKNMARRASDVLFVKIENDGFDLGAQRRAKDGSQIEEATHILCDFCTSCGKGDWPQKAQKAQKGLWLAVGRKRLLESPDVNLSGDRYRVVAARHTGKWPMVKLEDVFQTVTPPKKIQKSQFRDSGTYPIIDQSQMEIAGWSDDTTAVVSASKPLVIFGDHTCAVKYVDRPFVQGADGIKILETSDVLLPKFLFFCLQAFPVESEGYKRHFSALVRRQIPLPPLDEQERIVAELEGYRKVMEAARQILAAYKPTIRIDPEWPVVPVSEVCHEIRNGTNVEQSDQPGKYRVSRIQTISDWVVNLNKTKWTNNEPKPSDFLQNGDILLSHINSIDHLAKSAMFTSFDVPVVHGINLIKFRPKIELVLPPFLYAIMSSDAFVNTAKGFAQKAVNQASIKLSDLKAISVPLPPLAIQQKIVAELEAERKLVETNRELITRMEVKIKDKLAEVWGETGN
jgi:type I restriction enzyme M protein